MLVSKEASQGEHKVKEGNRGRKGVNESRKEGRKVERKKRHKP